MTILSLSLQRQQQQKNDVTPLNESKFADDHHLWRTSSNISDLKSCLQSDLKMINCWCHKWRINLTLKRTNVLLFNGKHKGKSEKISIKINQTAITQVPEKRILGVIIDEKLTFNPHINYISLQARKSFSRLAAFLSLTPATLVTIYKSFSRSRIEYCRSAWSHKLYSNNNFKALKFI